MSAEGAEGEDVCVVSIPVPEWQPLSRDAMVERLRGEEFDVLVVGGGAVGAGVAMDAQSRGLKVALVERSDFASATSSRSTKLIHGGLRYLAQAFQSKLPPESPVELLRNLHFKPEYLKTLRADLQERGWMLRSAPFMASPLPMLLPVYRWWQLPLYWVVGLIYDAIAGTERFVPPSRILSKEEAEFAFPNVCPSDEAGASLKGALLIHDGQQDDARMALHICLTAAQAGAVTANYVEVESLLESEGRIAGARVRERIHGHAFDVKAKQVVNACGIFSDTIRSMADPSCVPLMVPSVGTHLVLPPFDSSRGTGMVWFTKDGRVLYLLPWLGATLAGTTDAAGEVSFNPTPTAAEARFILSECNRVLRSPISESEIKAAWSGIRPLVRDPSAVRDASGGTAGLSREHIVEVLGCGLVTVAGGKWTTYRRMAQDAVDACVSSNPRLAHATACGTREIRLVGSDLEGASCFPDFDRIAQTLRDEFDFDRVSSNHLRCAYGTRALQIAALAQAEPEQYCDQTGEYKKLHRDYPPLEAEVAFACRHEFAQTAVDVLSSRTRLAFLDVGAAAAALPRVLSIMQTEKAWDQQTLEDQRAKAELFLQTMASPPRPQQLDAAPPPLQQAAAR